MGEAALAPLQRELFQMRKVAEIEAEIAALKEVVDKPPPPPPPSPLPLPPRLRWSSQKSRRGC